MKSLISFKKAFQMPTPVVSIITPTKNRKALLSESMTSVAGQDFAEWEHLIIDDGSDDGSLEMIADAASKDPRVRLSSRVGERSGANVCRNVGISEARGEFIVFLDSDDLLAPECLGRRVEIMRRNQDLDFAVFNTGYFVERLGDRRQQQKSEIFGDDLLKILCFELPWIITAPIWRTKSLRRLNGFDEAIPSWQDVELHLRAICGGMTYLRFPELDHHVRWQYEETKVSVMQRRSPDHLRAGQITLANFEEIVREEPGMDWSRQRAICGLYFFLAECWMKIGERACALACWRLARTRGLAAAPLHFMGCLWLLVRAQQNDDLTLLQRALHKWKGWVRFRINPDVL